MIYLKLKQLNNLEQIKKCVSFYSVYRLPLNLEQKDLGNRKNEIQGLLNLLAS